MSDKSVIQQGVSKAWTFKVLLLIFALVGASAWLGVGVLNGVSAPIREKFSVPQLMETLSGIFVLVLVIERVTEVFVAMLRDKDQIVRNRADEGTTEARAAELLAYKATTKRLALWLGFVLALLLCAGGVGVLESVLVKPSGGGADFFRALDILFTAGLLAGGSDGWHQWIAMIDAFFRRKKDEMRGDPSGGAGEG
jgi:hypothetical protein